MARKTAATATATLGLHAVTDQTVTISAPRISTATFACRGTAPLMVHSFSQKSTEAMRAAQEAGSQSKSKKTRAPKDFTEAFQSARYRSAEGDWDGVNAAAFRCAMISACRLVGFKMTLAKLSFWVLADGIDRSKTVPLVRIFGAEPAMDVRPARNSNGGMDLRARPIWHEWSCNVRVQWDLDQFSLADITNLLMRVGMQVGIGEGRPDSRMSAGLGYGTFSVVEGS